MPEVHQADSAGTNPTIFLRLNARDARPREIAWNDFHERYGPIIENFAKKLGARGQDVDDVVQEVMIGFYAKAPTFVYEPSRGRFRGYLKVCAFRAACKRFGRRATLASVPLTSLQEDALEVEHVWNDVWEKQQLEQAMSAVRARHHQDRSWQAFEQSVVHGRGAQEVADELGLTLSAVYKARERIGKELREKLKQMADEAG
jgi:RNA polymerase sigma-70 factor (ECF subfamily)